MKHNWKLANNSVHKTFGASYFFNGVNKLDETGYEAGDIVGYGINDKYGREIGRFYTIVETTCTLVPEGTPWNDSRNTYRSMYVGTKFEVKPANARDGEAYGANHKVTMFFDTLEEAMEGCRKDYNKHKAATARKAAKA